MDVSVNWLRDLVPGLTEEVEELAHRFSMTAAAVESMEPVGAELEDIVVARVLESGPHPNADRLKLCRVDAGGDPIDVVCGAPVVEQGALYPYVPAGATLPGGFKIESRKIRGEMSHGMLCSEIELGLGRDKSGIMRLPDGLEPGRPLTEVLGLPDVRLSLDLNPNRVDLASHVGVARELAVGGVSEVVLRETGGPSWSARWLDGEREASGGGVTVRIESSDRCSRYLGAIIRGVTVGPSPAWLAGRLLAIGARPINNVVDATNYVLFELNQPIHAFDLQTLSGSEIRVRAASDGESLRTLDGENRSLNSSVTAIADRDQAVALAGVMGGADTEVTAETSDLFIECAAFEPASVRDTGRAVSLATDASYRFERGIDERGLEAALTRCVELILATAGGEADPDGIRVGVLPPEPPVLSLRRSRVKQVLGIDPTPEELAHLLVPIGFDLEDGPATDAGFEGIDPGTAELRFRVPGWRRDVTREIDLIEEVARRVGFENFPHEDRRFRPSSVPDDPAWEQADRVRDFFVSRGLLEARSLSFMPAEYRGSRSEVAVPNPLSAEESCLRAGLVPVLLRRVEHNYARGRRDLRLYEIGTVFSYAAGEGAVHADGTERFHEELRVGAVIGGAREPQHWSGESEDLGLWDLKGLAGELAEQLCGARLEPVREGDDERVTALGGGWLADDRFRLVRDGQTFGVAGPVKTKAVDAPPWAAPLWAIEFELGSVRRRGSPTYRPLSSFPGVRRDLAVTVPVGSEAAALEAAITEAASSLLESVRLFDVYSGEGIHEERRSLAWAFRFRAEDRTLTDQEIDAEMKVITLALEEQFDARIRTT